MNINLKRLALGMVSAGILGLYGCGGGSSTTVGGGSNGGGGIVVATTDVPVSVIDGPIQNAQVCLDINNNGVCDTGEPTGKTDASGKVTIKVNTTDFGKYPVLAVVGTDAIDADTGAVPTPFTMKAPADQTAVITPLTTLVQNVVASTGSTSAAAADVVKAQTGINVSLFEDFSKGTTDDHKAAANIARMVVVTTQQQAETVKTAVGTADASGGTITKEDLDKAIQKKVMEMLPQMVALLSDPGVQDALKAAQAKIDAATGAAKTTAQTEKDALIKTPAVSVVASNGMTKDAVATNVAVNKQQESTAAVVAETPAAGFDIRSLSFTDVSNYFVRIVSGTVEQKTPDSKGNVRYVDNRYKAVNGAVANWNTGSDPTIQADLHWTGSTWAACQLNFESTSSVRDAKGNSDYNYCDNFQTGKSSRASLDISGKAMVDVLGDVVKAGYTNLGTVTDGVKTALGTTTFPKNSSVFYQSTTTLTAAIAYSPGSSWKVVQYSKSVSDGGDATKQPINELCNSPEFSGTISAGAPGGPAYASTLEAMIASKTGTPCSYAEGSFTYNGKTYKSGARRDYWGPSTASLGTIGTASVNSGTDAPGYYTTNTRLAVAFNGSGNNAVTYYACKQGFKDGAILNCDQIGTGSYVIQKVGDARTLSYIGMPAIASALDYTRVHVERGGSVYAGYQTRPTVGNAAGLNTVAGTALMAKLGLPAVTVDTPLALTQASYQGTWDAYPDSTPTTVGLTAKISNSGVLTS